MPLLVLLCPLLSVTVRVKLYFPSTKFPRNSTAWWSELFSTSYWKKKKCVELKCLYFVIIFYFCGCLMSVSPQRQGCYHLWSTGSWLHLCRQWSEIHLEWRSWQAERWVDLTQHGLLAAGPVLVEKHYERHWIQKPVWKTLMKYWMTYSKCSKVQCPCCPC